MKTILKRLQDLADDDLYALCEAVDQELHRRADTDTGDDDSLSARRRIVEREQSYRHRNGSAAPPLRLIGFGKLSKRRAA